MTDDLADGEALSQDGAHDLEQVAKALIEVGTAPLQPLPLKRPSSRHRNRQQASEEAAGVNHPEPWGQVRAEDDPLRCASEGEPAILYALLMLRDALKGAPGFLGQAENPGSVSVVHVPDRPWGRCIAEAWELIVHAREVVATANPDGQTVVVPEHSPRGMRSVYRRKPSAERSNDQFQVFEKRGRTGDGVDFLWDAMAKGKAAHVFTPDPEGLLSPDVLVVEAQRLRVPPPSLQMLAQFALFERKQDKRSLRRLMMAHTGLVHAAAQVSPLILNVAYRTCLTPEEFLTQIEVMVTRQHALLSKTPASPVLTLDGLPGLGVAGRWGRQIAADLRAYADGMLPWSELDRGVVLEGPPGVGKSTFARALAGSAGLPLVTSSLAQWQGSKDGHLGSLLSAMQATFETARGSAPCILLLDEIDSFPSRASVNHRHRDYVVEVVNGLLEQLDGAVQRTGVVVIGTCNDASHLDPALMRPGRLERIIRVDRPNADGIEEILRLHLGDAVVVEDLEPLAATAVMRQAVGANIEAWCRGARRRARVAGRPLVLADLADEIGPPVPRHSPDAVWRMAVHEAGHAVAFAHMGPGILQHVIVDPIVGGRSTTSVDALGLYQEMPHATREQALKYIQASLSGRAAEEVILGGASGGAGGTDGSDLERATRLACLIVASSGLDDHPDALVFLGAADDQQRFDQLLLDLDIRQRVGGVVRQVYNDALALIRTNRNAVEKIAYALMERGMMSGREAEILMAGDPGECVASGDGS